MIVYFPFVCAEFCGISGIVTLLFTAMFSQRYVAPNLSERTANEAEVCQENEEKRALISLSKEAQGAKRRCPLRRRAKRDKLRIRLRTP